MVALVSCFVAGYIFHVLYEAVTWNNLNAYSTYKVKKAHARAGVNFHPLCVHPGTMTHTSRGKGRGHNRLPSSSIGCFFPFLYLTLQLAVGWATYCILNLLSLLLWVTKYELAGLVEDFERLLRLKCSTHCLAVIESQRFPLTAAPWRMEKLTPTPRKLNVTPHREGVGERRSSECTGGDGSYCWCSACSTALTQWWVTGNHFVKLLSPNYYFQ